MIFLSKGGGSVDTHMGGPLARIFVESLEKFFVSAFSNLCHCFKLGLAICFVPLDGCRAHIGRLFFLHFF